ncbi:hypothetical protein [Novosphingobium sp. FKTRR1]|uniref:hypothetical protein n=1 Tax=Novosphingobium sp. FKTRR1 TaxID=2879118 RepID=UPI001CF072DD|nr:hypothetical protein [Novosphingobium sp. FKTRR1]
MPQTYSAEIVPLRRRAAASPAQPDHAEQAPPNAPLALELGQRGQFCGVMYVARQMRLQAVDLRTVVTHIRAHITASGFPQPVTSRLRHGLPATGAAAVTPKSEWLRAAVDAWVAQRASGSIGGYLGSNPDRVAHIEATLQARFRGQRA